MSDDSSDSKTTEIQENLAAEKLTPKKNSVYRAPILANNEQQNLHQFYIVKRDGRKEPVSLDKILWRINVLSENLCVKPVKLAHEVIDDLYDGIESYKIDEIAAEKAHHWCTIHPDYDSLASRIAISNHHKQTLGIFSQVIWELYQDGLIDKNLYDIVQDNSDLIDDTIDYERDYYLSYLGFKTFEYSYSMRKDRIPFERPQQMFMRVALGIHGDDLEAAFETYDWMSCKYFIHATPTLFNSGTPIPQMSSCFLVAMKEEKEAPHDSIDKIYDTVKECANISKTAGGIGVHIHNIRSKGSLIRSAGRGSSGIVPMIQVFNATARYVDQGRRRKGAFAIYLEPHHPDIFDFLDLKKPHGSEELRARDLHYALWIPDLFMQRVENDQMWSLMCPDKCPELSRTWGDEFETHYLRYEREGTFIKQVRARVLFSAIVEAQMETGEPYMLYKDSCNRKSNQQNIGTIKSSNLCVAPYTRITTDNGEVKISDCVGKEVNVWNGFEWSNVKVCKTGENQRLMRVNFSNGRRVDCTYYHKFYLRDGSCKEAKDLNVGDKLITFNDPLNNSVRKQFEVTATSELSGLFDTYCFTEQKRGMGMFEGVVLGNCAEIIEYSDNDETSVCNLCSLGLPAYVSENEAGKMEFDHQTLHYVAKMAARNLNKIIDKNFYPTEQARRSNMRHRPVGIGVQGLANVFIQMRYPFESQEAKQLNFEIFETIYHGALEASMELAKEEGPYETFRGSPASKGILQFDMWKRNPTDRWNWRRLRKDIKKHGIRNSLLIALMPTASSSQLLGYNECFEPYTSNLYTRKLLSGTFKIINRQLIMDLIERGLWSDKMKQLIIANGGSVQNLPIPTELKELYKTSWEIKQRVIIDQAADRGAFVCQSQSMNLFVARPSVAMLSTIHMYAWKKGLKTGQYYLRSKPAVAPMKATLDFSIEEEARKTRSEEISEELMCVGEQEDCLMCGS